MIMILCKLKIEFSPFYYLWMNCNTHAHIMRYNQPLPSPAGGA